MQSDCFYNAGWTHDIRDVVNHLHHEYPDAPLYIVGTSIGANILVQLSDLSEVSICHSGFRRHLECFL